MAKHGKRRNRDFSRYIDGNIQTAMALGTLVSRTVVSQVVNQTVVDSTRISSIKCTYSLNNFTIGASRGPIMFGVAHGDYTTAEIEAWIEATSGWNQGDMIAKEVRSRRIRTIGILVPPATLGEQAQFNDGRPVKTKLNWLLAEGQTISFWAYNLGSVALANTDPVLLATGRANLWVV